MPTAGHAFPYPLYQACCCWYSCRRKEGNIHTAWPCSDPPQQGQQTALLAQLTQGRQDTELREEGGEKSVQGLLSSPSDFEGRGPDGRLSAFDDKVPAALGAVQPPISPRENVIHFPCLTPSGPLSNQRGYERGLELAVLRVAVLSC